MKDKDIKEVMYLVNMLEGTNYDIGFHEIDKGERFDLLAKAQNARVQEREKYRHELTELLRTL